MYLLVKEMVAERTDNCYSVDKIVGGCVITAVVTESKFKSVVPVQVFCMRYQATVTIDHAHKQ